jgi:hypothetical protein
MKSPQPSEQPIPNHDNFGKTPPSDANYTYHPNERVSDKIASDILGTKPQTMRRWRFEGRGPRYCKIGALVRYKVADLEEFISQRIIETTDSARAKVA